MVSVDPGTATAGVCVWSSVKWARSCKLGTLAAGPEDAISISLPRSSGGLYVERAFQLKERVKDFLQPYQTRVERLIVEEMAIYPGRMDAAQDVLGISFFCGVLASDFWALGAEVEMAPVINWKGNMKKGMTAKRIQRRFEEAGLETDKLTSIGKPGHDWDACGIGLWAMGLFGDRASD